MRDVVLRSEPIWDNWSAAAVAAWGLAGLLITVRRFRWEPREG